MEMPSGPQFPLAPEKRPRISVDRYTVAQWQRQARLEIAALLQDRESWYYKGKDATSHHQLALAFNKHDVRGYTPFKTTAQRTPYFCHGVLNLSLEDVAYALYSDSTDHQRTIGTHLYQENFLDAAVLDVYERQITEDPFRFAGVKWGASRIPPGLVASSELLYFEYSCKTQDADGHIVLVQYIRSPEFLPGQFEDQNHAGLARAKVNQISTFQFLEGGTHCQSTGWFEASASVPVWVAAKAVQQVFSNMGHLVGLADARAIVTLGTANVVSSSKACYLCSKKFGMLSKRHNCRSCGQSICAKCTIKLKVPSRLSSSPPSEQQQQSVGNTKSVLKFIEGKFCLPCVLQAREKRPESGSFSDMKGSLSSDATASPSIDEGYDLDWSDLHDSSDDVLGGGALYDHHNPRPAELSIEVYLSRARDASSLKKTIQQRKKKRATSHPPDGISSRGLRPATIAEQPDGSTGAWMKRESVYAQQTKNPPKTGAAPALPAAFDKLSQAIAAQEALLQTIRQERSKFHARQQQQSAERRRAASEDPDPVLYETSNGRFEVVQEEEKVC